MYRTDTEWPQQYTQLACPLSACHWLHNVSGPVSVIEGRTASVLMMQHALTVEGIVLDHLKTHALIEWVQEVMDLRERADRAERALAERAQK